MSEFIHVGVGVRKSPAAWMDRIWFLCGWRPFAKTFLVVKSLLAVLAVQKGVSCVLFVRRVACWTVLAFFEDFFLLRQAKVGTFEDERGCCLRLSETAGVSGGPSWANWRYGCPTPGPGSCSSGPSIRTLGRPAPADDPVCDFSA